MYVPANQEASHNKQLKYICICWQNQKVSASLGVQSFIHLLVVLKRTAVHN